MNERWTLKTERDKPHGVCVGRLSREFALRFMVWLTIFSDYEPADFVLLTDSNSVIIPRTYASVAADCGAPPLRLLPVGWVCFVKVTLTLVQVAMISSVPLR